MTSKQKHQRAAHRREVRAMRAEGYTQEGICQGCGQPISRNVYPGQEPGPWWHDMSGQDRQHETVPVGWRGFGRELVAWVRGEAQGDLNIRTPVLFKGVIGGSIHDTTTTKKG